VCRRAQQTRHAVCVAACCSVLQCVAVCCSVLQCITAYSSKHAISYWKRISICSASTTHLSAPDPKISPSTVAVCCSVLQRVLQCVAVSGRAPCWCCSVRRVSQIQNLSINCCIVLKCVLQCVLQCVSEHHTL